MKKTMILLIACFMLTSLAIAESCDAGRQAFNEKNFKSANKLLTKCLKSNPSDSSLNYMKGMSLVKLSKHKEAIEYLQVAIDNNIRFIPLAKYNIGYCHLRLGNSDLAMGWMEEAVDLGFRRFTDFQTGDFAWIKDSERFRSITKKAYENAYPCLKGESNNKFDFWLGEWEVYTNGAKTAQSKITKAVGGCAVHEDYTTFSGLYSGQSISYFDTESELWNQYWVGSAGDKSKYYETENYEADLEFMTKSKNANGNSTWIIMSYTMEDENTVIQELKSSNDEGETWNQSFKGTYKRK